MATRKILFQTSDGTVLGMGYTDFNPPAGQDQDTIGSDFVLPSPVLGNNTYDKVTKTASLKDEATIAFNNFQPGLTLGRMAQEYTPERLLALAPYGFAVQSFISYKNFTQLKQFFAGLIQTGAGTADDYNVIKNILLEQGIDLDNF